jgi:hypothetical protein
MTCPHINNKTFMKLAQYLPTVMTVECLGCQEDCSFAEPQDWKWNPDEVGMLIDTGDFKGKFIMKGGEVNEV